MFVAVTHALLFERCLETIGSVNQKFVLGATRSDVLKSLWWLRGLYFMMIFLSKWILDFESPLSCFEWLLRVQYSLFHLEIAFLLFLIHFAFFTASSVPLSSVLHSNLLFSPL
jgi:hypothetical protein